MVLMQTHKQEAIRHNPPWQSSLQNLLVSWGGEPGAAEVGWLGVQRGRGTHEGYSRAGCGTAVCISSADVCRATW